MTYGQPPTPAIKKAITDNDAYRNVMELNRLCLLPEYNGKNYASMLVGRSLRMLPKNYYIVSYSDTQWGHVGYVYQATNWLYTGKTKPRRDSIGIGGKHPRHYKVGETVKVLRSAKHRYVYMTGNWKEMRKYLKWEVIPQYPKGNTRRYDTENPLPETPKERCMELLDSL